MTENNPEINTETRKGSCLCKTVTFEITGSISGVGQCHCSKCRKASGTASNAMIIIGARRFRWTSGEQHTQRFDSGNHWSVTRCKTCGSPLPASHDGKRVWVPAGLMDDPLNAQINGHIFVASTADWDVIHDDAPQFDEYPP